MTRKWWNPMTWFGHKDTTGVDDAKDRLKRVLADDSTVDEVTAHGTRLVRENGFVLAIENALRVRRQ